MSYWNAKYPNDRGEYEITFGSKSREITKAVEKVCTAVMDGRVRFLEDVEIVVHAHWICDCEPYHICSNCHHKFSLFDRVPRCPNCGAHMDERLELRTGYCPLCDKDIRVRSNDSMGHCPDCGHDVVLHIEGETNG